MVASDIADAPLDRLIALAQEKGLRVSAVGAKRIPTGKSPHSVAVNPDGTRLFTTDFKSGTVSVIDIGRAIVVETIQAVEGPYGLAANPNGRVLHVAAPDSEMLVRIDILGGIPTHSGFGHAPYGVAVSPDGDRVYLTLALEDSVLVTDQFAKARFSEIHGIAFPTGVAVTSDENLLYATNYFADTVSVVDIAGEKVIATVPVGQGPYGVALSPAGDRLYVAHFPFDSVSVIDTTDRTVTRTIPVSDGPRGVAVSPDGTRLYVTNFFADTVTVIEL
ncbi:beta-propeller fold lactonase family protein [Kitasatospora sp. NPDC048296]|uniref:YVTN family beta-propeller repeat protein n=1 Tax=Kitasatospora sp. NPDC048296 TaxID=3364048 RepID=UPI00371E3819